MDESFETTCFRYEVLRVYQYETTRFDTPPHNGHLTPSPQANMPFLIAQGPEPTQNSQREIASGKTLQIGRMPECDLSIGWDRRISRRHADLSWDGGRLSIACHDGVLNPIVYRGSACKAAEMRIGEEFRIGRTVFRVAEDDSSSDIRRFLNQEGSTDEGGTQYSLSAVDNRLSLISKYTQSLWMSAHESELAASLVNILAEIIPHASAVAILQCSCTGKDLCERPQIIQSESRNRSEKMLLSRPMIAAALKRRQTLVRVRRTSGGPLEADSGRWVLCCPALSGEVETENWCLYISGSYGPDQPLPSTLTTDDLASDVQVTDVVAQLAAAIRRVKMLEDRFAGIRQFFSPAVAEAVASSNLAVSLKPTESATAVLFCDLRGYSKIVERSKSHLHGLLDRINKALEVMTQNIIGHDGVIADFQGDSALGFWGWPLKLEEGALPACRAALDILRVFGRAARRQPASKIVPCKFGIGIACGPAIAGRIGTRQQAKVGVFGPVVNLGSRLEGMTKQIGVPILIDEATAMVVRKDFDETEGRCRRIGQFCPAGMETPVEVYELLPPEDESHITNEHIRTFEAAVDAFIEGAWDDALDLLSEMPARDRAKDFLLMQIASHNYEPPEDWDGVIQMKKK